MVEQPIVVEELLDRTAGSVSPQSENSPDSTLAISWPFSPDGVKLCTPIAKLNNLVGEEFICSMPRYIVNITKPLEWVAEGSTHKLCISKTPKPQLLLFWITGFVSAQYLGALCTYQNTYALDVHVTNDVLAKIRKFFTIKPYKDRAPAYQSPLRLKALFADVKRECNELGASNLPEVDLPQDEISDFPLIFDGSQLTKHSDDPPEGLTLLHLDDNGFVAIELSAMAYQIRDAAGYKLGFRRIYTLRGKTLWQDQVKKKARAR